MNLLQIINSAGILMMGLLLPVLPIAQAQMVVNPYRFAAGGGGSSYVLEENFTNPSGYDVSGWVGEGTPNPNATAPAGMSGEAGDLTAASTAISKNLTGMDDFNLYFQIRVTTPSIYATPVIIATPSFAADVLRIVISEDTKWCMRTLDGGYLPSLGAGFGSTVASNTTYHFWIEVVKGTGANGIVRIYISTTSTKPGSPTYTKTDYNNTSQSGGLKIGFYIFDRILVSSTPIGSTP